MIGNFYSFIIFSKLFNNLFFFIANNDNYFINKFVDFFEIMLQKRFSIYFYKSLWYVICKRFESHSFASSKDYCFHLFHFINLYVLKYIFISFFYKK